MEQEPRRRRRPALSCVECRRRKIKCDRKDPCTHCILNKSHCAYRTYNDTAAQRQRRSRSPLNSPSSLSTNAPAAPVQVAQVAQLDAETSDHSFPWFRRQQGSSPAPPPPSFGQLPTPSHSQSTDQDVRDLLRRVQRLESSASSPAHGRSETSGDVYTPQSSLQDQQILLKKTRILGWSRWASEIREFNKVINCFQVAIGGNSMDIQDPETTSLLAQTGVFLQKCKILARANKVGRPSRTLANPEFVLAPPPREVADTMVSLYLKSFESTHRILHIPTFWAEYHRFWDNPDGVKTGLRLKILLAIGLGSSLSDYGDNNPEFRDMVHNWVYAAQAWLSGPLEKDRLDITGLQVRCLLISARQIFSIGGDLVWISIGSLVHQAMLLGLHRDPKHLPNMSILQAELRRRLWATILEMLVQASLDSSMPPRISFDEFDTEPPSNSNDDEISETTMLLTPHPRSTFTETSAQLILLDSLRKRIRIVQLLYGLHSELTYGDIAALSADILEACRKCTSFAEENKSSGLTPFQRNLLDYLVRRFLVPLNLPFASRERTDPLCSYCRKISVDAAMVIISPEPDEGYSRLISMGGGLFREGFRVALTAISMEFIALAETQVLDGTMHRYPQQREILKQAVQSMITRSEERVRRGETNIKGHMFLCMILGQVEALEAGSSCELEMARRGKDSTEFCYNVLQELAEARSPPVPTDLTVTPGFGGSDGFAMDFDMGFLFPDGGFSY